MGADSNACDVGDYTGESSRGGQCDNGCGGMAQLLRRDQGIFSVPGSYIYCPQRSCEGYVFTGVCLSTGGGT